MKVEDFIEIIKKSIQGNEEGQIPMMVKYNDTLIELKGTIDLKIIVSLLEEQVKEEYNKKDN